MGGALVALGLGALAVRSTHRPPAAPADDAEAVSRLRALPYAAGVPVDARDRRAGVVRHERGAVQPGLTLHDVAGSKVALLVDEEGRLVHSWRRRGSRDDERTWQHVRLLPGGDLLALTPGHAIERLNLAGDPLWENRGDFHHELEIAPDGTLWTARAESVAFRGRHLRDETIVRLDPATGRELAATSILPLFADRIDDDDLAAIDAWEAANPTHVVPVRQDAPGDLFHLNRIEVLRRPLAGVAPAGAVLIALCHRDTVAILSPALDRVLWQWGRGVLSRPHLPTQLDDRRLLVFDNGRSRGISRLLEVEPAAQRIVWSWTAAPPDWFFSASRGSAQRLPNGNTLIAESDAGRLLEIAPDGRVVWEYLLHLMRSYPGMPSERHAVYRAHRLTDAEAADVRAALARARQETGRAPEEAP